MLLSQEQRGYIKSKGNDTENHHFQVIILYFVRI